MSFIDNVTTTKEERQIKEICEECVHAPYTSCNADWEQILLDDVTGKICDCDLYEKRESYKLKITYEWEDKYAEVETEVYELPAVRWKTKKAKEQDKGLYGEFKNVKLTDEELEKLKKTYPHEYQDGIEALSGYIAQVPQKAKKYKSHYAVIQTWIRRDRKKKAEREAESKSREARRQNKDKLQSEPTYDLEKIKRDAMNNTEL